MKNIEWSPKLAIGVEVIDGQHQQWIQRFNNVAAAIAAQEGPVQIGKTLDFLISYTQQHFATEEKIMTAAGYPDLPAHLAQHRELTQTLQDLLRDFEEEGATQKLADTVGSYLRNWLINHIQKTDRKFGVFAQQNK